MGGDFIEVAKEGGGGEKRRRREEEEEERKLEKGEEGDKTSEKISDWKIV